MKNQREPETDPSRAARLSETPDPWAIGIYVGDSPLNLAPRDGCDRPVLTRRDVTDAAAAFIADPFMVRRGGSWFMFFEVLNAQSGRGEIGLATSPDAFVWGYAGLVLREPFHLSYPYVFEREGELFMIPETLGAGAITLYVADSFPHRWRRVAVLLEGRWADPSVFFHQGRWWMFACPTPESHDALRLFYADELQGTWREHPASPIITGDKRRARPAGRVVVCEGRVIRYAQDCFPRYGSQVRAYEITELTTTRYIERESARSPVLKASAHGWNGRGMHHLDPHPLDDGAWVACVDGHALPGCG